MLRTLSLSLPSSVRAFSTSSPSHAARKASSVIRKQNIIKQSQRAQAALADRPSVVLGTRPSEESIKWPACDLAKVLVDEASLYSPSSSSSSSAGASTSSLKPVETSVGTVNVPAQPAFGVAEAEQKLLFDHLPKLTAEAASQPTTIAIGSPPPAYMPDVATLNEIATQKELEKANMFAKVVDLKNANAAGIAFENRRRIVAAFSTPENPFDTGRAEVQGACSRCSQFISYSVTPPVSSPAALKTYQIRKLWRHLLQNKKDVGNRRGLRKLVHERAKILRYLRNTNRDRYEIILERLALEPEAVEGELVV